LASHVRALHATGANRAPAKQLDAAFWRMYRTAHDPSVGLSISDHGHTFFAPNLRGVDHPQRMRLAKFSTAF
jgi:hypothetical protein